MAVIYDSKKIISLVITKQVFGKNFRSRGQELQRVLFSSLLKIDHGHLRQRKCKKMPGCHKLFFAWSSLL